MLTADGVAAAARDLERADPREILEWAGVHASPVALSSSFGADSAVLLHLASQVSVRPTVLFVDTGYHFAETLSFGRKLTQQLGLVLSEVRPRLSVDEYERRNGAEHRTDPDRCCAVRKVAPLDDALIGFGAWATGVRRDQTPERRLVPVVSMEPLGETQVVKVAPIATWSRERVDRYLTDWSLPRNPLTEAGYRSIGCAPCTAPTGDGVDPRSGRWSGFEGKTECGLHQPRIPRQREG